MIFIFQLFYNSIGAPAVYQMLFFVTLSYTVNWPVLIQQKYDKYKTNIKQIQNKYTTNTKQIQNKYKTNIKQIYNKYTTNIQQIYNNIQQIYKKNI